MIENIKNNIKESLRNTFNDATLNVVIEKPKKPELGDFSIPVFVISKKLGQPLPEVAKKVAEALESIEVIDTVDVMGGFINLKLNRTIIASKIIDLVDETYGSSDLGKGKNIVIDYSAPNIAKSFGIGHLRSTIIGHSLKMIYKKLGYNVIGVNHLGDWGTQFGKLIYAYKTWSSEEALVNEPIKELMRIYVKFHKELETDPSLDDHGRSEFKKLEDGDVENKKLWEKFRHESLKDFMDMYDLLGVEFDSYNGEAFYIDKSEGVIKDLEDKNLLVEDQGAMIVKLGDTMPPALIKRTDGATLYMTRDVCALKYRKDTYNFDKVLYVVGNEQSLHFKQLNEVSKKIGYTENDEQVKHINFGLYLTEGKKMSTRKGKTVKLIDVIDESCKMALQYIEDKNPSLENKKEIAEKVGVSAIIFNDLKNDRTNNIEFNLDNIVKFEGQTGPYLQYTTVRIKSILETNNFNDSIKTNADFYTSDYAYDLIKHLSEYPQTIEKALNENSPHHVSKFLLSLASAFNSFYANERINAEDEIEKNTRLKLISKVLLVMESGFNLLGIRKVEKM